MYQAQLPLINKYLKEVAEKKERLSLEKKIQANLAMLQDSQFNHCKLPPNKLQFIEKSVDNKNEQKAQSSAQDFSNILKKLKKIFEEKESKYKKLLSSDEYNYLKLYLKILFWDSDDNKNLQQNTDDSLKELSKEIKSYTIDFYYEKLDSENKDCGIKRTYLKDKHLSEIMDGLIISVHIRNLYFLESFNPIFKQFKKNNKKLFHDFFPNLPFSATIFDFPTSLLSLAVFNEDEAITRFILKNKIKNPHHYYYIAINITLRHGYYPLMIYFLSKKITKSIIEVSINKLDEFDKLELPKFDPSYEVVNSFCSELNFLIFAILFTAIPNAKIMTYLLNKLCCEAYTIIKNLQGNIFAIQDSKSKIRVLEGIRLMLVLGVDPKKLKHFKAQATINYLIEYVKNPVPEKFLALPLENDEKKISPLFKKAQKFNSNFKKINFSDIMSAETNFLKMTGEPKNQSFIDNDFKIAVTEPFLWYA